MTSLPVPAFRNSAPPASPSGPAGTGPAGPAGRRPSRRKEQPGPARLADMFCRLFCEVEAGRRAARQLEPLLDPLLYARLATVWVRPGPAATLLSVRGSSVAPGVYEAVALVRRGGRCAALAVRLVRRLGRWVVEDVGRPEDGPLPPPAWPVPPPPFDEDGWPVPVHHGSAWNVHRVR